MKLLRRSGFKRMPWKNGQGITEEVMTFPPGSDIATFGWRLSIAHVGADGPFSVFPGIDRTIALLDGAGLYLDMSGETVELGPRSDPFPFSGDLKISSRNRGGATIDLNIMTRRGQFNHRMLRIRGGIIDIEKHTVVLVFNEAAMVFAGDELVEVDRFDALLVEPVDAPLRVPPGTDMLVIEISGL